MGPGSTNAAVSGPTFGNPDSPPQGGPTVDGNAENMRILGPQNQALESLFPHDLAPPPTDVGSLPQFWATFQNSHRRRLDGGWTREVTARDFPISTEIAGVNMRLGPGGVRELHWHQAAEWAYMLAGRARITTIDPQGRAFVGDVTAGDLWFFPSGYPHSLQGLGAEGAEFILCFDNGEQSEENTIQLTPWMAHTPPEVLALNFGLPGQVFSNTPLHEKYIFAAKQPGDLSADRAEVSRGAGSAGQPPHPAIYRLASGPRQFSSRGGYVQIADSTNFPAIIPGSSPSPMHPGVTAALVTVHPGGIRAMHWHPNADEWQYYVKGKAQMTVFDTGPKVVTKDFTAGDVGYIKRNLGHYILNTGQDDLVFLEVFKSSHYESIDLSGWLKHTPAQMVMSTLNISRDTYDRLPIGGSPVMPA